MGAPVVIVTGKHVCAICDTVEPSFRWTDAHGIGACLVCGAPHQIYHYEGEGDNKHRVDGKPPELLISPKWVGFIRRYWQEKHRNVDPGGFNFPGSSYEVATQEDADELSVWMDAHKDEQPKSEEE